MYLQWPWVCFPIKFTLWVELGFCAAMMGLGFAMFFFGDRNLDRKIRLLQSRSYRTFYRFTGLGGGLVFMAAGLFITWVFATYRLS